MAYRFTNTDKWGDAWFSELRPIEKLLFNYLCDNCDIAGFIEITLKKWAIEIGTDKPQIEGALKGLERGLTYSNEGDCIYLNNFIKHQKNLPINENNKSHIGILYRFEMYKSKFGITDINEFIQAPSKGLQSPIGIGKGISNDLSIDCIKTWREDYEIFLNELRSSFQSITNDKIWMKEKERFHPNVDISLSIEKVCKEYWATDVGWKKKKGVKATKTIDWKATFTNSLNQKQNLVYKQNIIKQANEQPEPTYYKPAKLD